MKMKKMFFSLILTIMLVLISVTNVHASTKDIFHNFTSLSLKTTNAKMGEKVYVDFYGDTKEIESVILELINKEENIMLVVGIEDLNTQNPYFVLPESTITGVTYEIISINVKCNHGSIKYSTILGKENFTNCFGKKYLTVEKEVDVNLTCLALGSHYTSVKNGEKLWLIAEFKGDVKANFVTMLVKNKENPEIKALVSLKESNHLQYIDVFDIGTQDALKNGTYYISDVFINPNKEDYIRYTLDECSEDGRKLEFYVEFEIDVEEYKDDQNLEDTTKEDKECNSIPDIENNESNETERINESEIELEHSENIDKNKSSNNVTDNSQENNRTPDKENNETAQNENINKDENEIEHSENIDEDKPSNKITDNKPEDEDDSLNKKIYELLLKILELLTIIEKNNK